MISIRFTSTRRNGFSLAELMVAMVVCILITISLFSMVGQSARTHRLTMNSATSIADARSLFHFIETDLRSHLHGSRWRNQVITGSDAQLAFLRQKNHQEQRVEDPNNQLGDIVLVHYYVAYRATSSREATQKLFRHVLTAAETDAWRRLGDSAPFPVGDPSKDEPLLDRVLHFDVKLWERDSQGKWIEWKNTSDNPPSKCELSLALCDELSAQRLRTESDWKNLSQRASSETNVGGDHQVQRFTKSITLSP